MKTLLFSLICAACLAGASAPAFAAPDLRATSSNWSGYVADNGTYTGAGASWRVPAASSASRLASDAEWVGVGGVRSSDLIQAGTEAIVQNGRVGYKAWYELLPSGQETVPIVLHAGDRVTVSLVEQPSGQWHLAFEDTTTGRSYATDLSYDSSESSAEWIVEAPVATDGTSSALVPLDDFGSVGFTGAFAIRDGARETAGAAGATALTMARGPLALATPSALATDSFSVSRASEAVLPPGSDDRYRYRAGMRMRAFPFSERIIVVWAGP